MASLSTPLSWHQRDSGKHPGFSLVELLVVIAIVAILAGILIPVVGNMVDQSHVSTNVSNLRQINQAAGLWSADNGGVVIPTYDPGDAKADSFKNWTGHLAPYLGWNRDVNVFESAKDMPVYVNPFYPDRWGYGHNHVGLRFIKRTGSNYNETYARYDQISAPGNAVFFATSRSGKDDETFMEGWRGYVRPPGIVGDYVVDYTGPGGKAVVLWLDGRVSTEAEGALDDPDLWTTEATANSSS